MILLIFFLILIVVGVNGFFPSQGSGLHHPWEWVIDLGVGGTLLSMALFETARGRSRARSRLRQLAWALVPLLSGGLLAFVPFLWLALIRRRARERAAVAVYLAAETTLLFSTGLAMIEIVTVLLAIAPVHVALAFNPAGGPSSRREARAARENPEPAD